MLGTLRNLSLFVLISVFSFFSTLNATEIGDPGGDGCGWCYGGAEGWCYFNGEPIEECHNLSFCLDNGCLSYVCEDPEDGMGVICQT